MERIEAVVTCLRRPLRIWLNDDLFLSDYIAADKAAVAIEIINHPGQPVVNVVSGDESILYSRMVEFPYEQLRNYASVVDNLPVWMGEAEKTPRYRIRVIELNDRLRLSLEGIDDADRPNMH